MKSVLIVGAGGHGQVVADLLLRYREGGEPLELLGFLDDDDGLRGRTFLGLDVLGPIAAAGNWPEAAVTVAVGDNRERRRIGDSLRSAGHRLHSAVHPRAVIAPDVQLGDGLMVCAGVVVNTGSRIGDGAILNTGCSVDHHGRIGAWSHVAPGARLGGNVTLGEGAMACIGATVVPGRTLGDWCTVGAGSVVTRDVPPEATAVGSPARVTRSGPPSGR